MKRLSYELFSRFAALTYELSGIEIPKEKVKIFQIKLDKVLRLIPAVKNYEELYALLSSGRDNEMLEVYLNVVTTNTTDFFREDRHFDFLKSYWRTLLETVPSIRGNGELRIWSAAASTGQEAVTVAIVLSEIAGQAYQLKILGTDINTEVLKRAINGSYTQLEVKGISRYHLANYFEQKDGIYHVNKNIRQLITFRQFNLNDNFPFKHKFDIILCRNVMIYFPKDVRERLITKMCQVLNVNGLLMIGHSETIDHGKFCLERLEPSIYRKVK